METRKKTASEMDILRAEESLAGTTAKAKTARVSKAPGAAAGKKAAANSAALVKTAAATHKAPARKTASVEFEVAAHHEEISVEAYHHWLRRGAPHGSDQHDWLAAIEIVRARYRA